MLQPRKIFTAVGQPKAIIWAAKMNKIETYLFQHAGIIFEEVEYSYPSFITPDSNILFPVKLLTYGSYWGKGMNIPAKEIVVIGNDYYKPHQKETSAPYKNNILVISTIIHGKQLSEFIHKYAKNKKDLNFVFKLHPNEFHLKNYYENYFKSISNIRIITTEMDTSDLINCSELIILIVSTVLYEALDMGRKVAVYKKINYERYKSLEGYPNLYFFDSEEEIEKILQREEQKNEILFRFYEPLKSDILHKISK